MAEPRQTKADLPPIPAKRYFTIAGVRALGAAKPPVLPFWEQEFPQLKPVKRRGNRRYYQHHEVLLIRRIRDLLYEQGFTINGARHRLETETLDSTPESGDGRVRDPAVRRAAALSSDQLRQVIEEIRQLLGSGG